MTDTLTRGTVLLFLAIMLGACQSGGQLKPISEIEPGVAKEGTIANAKLIADTTAALESLPFGSIPGGARVIKFVIQQPVGIPGSRSWREMWIADPEGDSKSFLITFRETSYGADYEIEPMLNTIPGSPEDEPDGDGTDKEPE